MLTTGNQLRAARALAGIEQRDLAAKAEVHVNTIRNMEAKGAAEITSAADVVRRIERALEAIGVEFLNHGQPGVRLRKVLEDQGRAISTQIATLEAKIADMPSEGDPSPENGMNTMRKAVAENDLLHLKGRRRKSEQK